MDNGEDESFADAPGIPLEEQQQYIYSKFEEHLGYFPTGYEERERRYNWICVCCAQAADVEQGADGKAELDELLESLKDPSEQEDEEELGGDDDEGTNDKKEMNVREDREYKEGWQCRCAHVSVPA